MRDIFRLIIVLTVISAVAGGALALVNSFTEPKIIAYKENVEVAAYQGALPQAELFKEDLQLLKQVKSNPELALIQNIKIGVKNGETVGWVCKVASPGYSSNIELLVGIGKNGKIGKVLILDQKETPGLGTNITNPEFIEQKAIYENNLSQDLKVNKDGGSVQAVTGATISSRAVLRGINQSLKLFRSLNVNP